MKKRCGQSMDRISQLPDAVLAKILSSLPTTKGVVATAVLSKQWRFLWKMVPKLTFRYNGGNDIQGFSDSVRRTMLSLESPYLQSLHLDVSLGEDDRMDGFGELVGIACGLHVRELVLKLSRPGLNRYPIILDNCQSLETLKLRGSIALEVPSPVSLTSLRTLHLEDVFYDSESVVNLLSGCVRLENLFVTRNSDDGVETFTVPAGSIFNQLEHLQLFTECLPSWNPLMVLLDNSPNLQVLEIIGEHDRQLTWKEPKHVPQCFLHLKKLDWLVRGLTYGEEVAEYILSNAESLENVILRIDCLYCDGDEDFPEEDRLEVWHDFQAWCPDDCEFELISI